MWGLGVVFGWGWVMFLLGRKIGMTQLVDGQGRSVPVTLIKAGPCRVLRVKTVASDGYRAIQVGFESRAGRSVSRSERGQVVNVGGCGDLVAVSGGEPSRVIREVRLPEGAVAMSVGDILDVGSFDGVGFVDVVGVTKGRGFAGVMKRHNFSGLGAAHGVKKVHRSGGSVGQNTYPGRVFPGQKMAGRYGGSRVTVRNLRLFLVDRGRGVLAVKGAVPGPNGGVVIVRHPKEPPRSQV